MTDLPDSQPHLLARMIDVITAGPYWVLKSLVVVLIAAGMFSFAPAVIAFPNLSLPPAYELKSTNPLADTAKLTIPEHPGERSHGAKLTPRLVGSFALFFATQLSLHPYIPASIGGLIYLLSGIVVGRRITGDRVTALFTGLLLAGLYAVNACFSMNFDPKPFDGVALGCVALCAMLIDRPGWMAAAAFAGCWSDERAVVSLSLIGLTIILMPDLERPTRLRRCATLLAAVVAYVLTRVVVASLGQWSASDFSMLGDDPVSALQMVQFATWSCFEGGWVVIGLACWVLCRQGAYGRCALLLGMCLATIASCLIVLDISRASAFAFPLIFAGLAVLANQPANRSMWRIAAAGGAVVALLATNFEIIAMIAVQPLPSTPVWWLVTTVMGQ